YTLPEGAAFFGYPAGTGTIWENNIAEATGMGENYYAGIGNQAQWGPNVDNQILGNIDISEGFGGGAMAANGSSDYSWQPKNYVFNNNVAIGAMSGVSMRGGWNTTIEHLTLLGPSLYGGVTTDNALGHYQGPNNTAPSSTTARNILVIGTGMKGSCGS